jgi:ubiquitin-conjugating enzyme E2 Z
MSKNISKESISRLVKDITYIRKNPLHDNGIYYIHDEEDMLKGYAMIIGPPETPYSGGFYLFEFDFPTNYPFAPPKVNYLTNNGEIRFNPNLYKNGKVCISILNTWSGDQWSSCQTLNSILLTLCSILNNNPLLNEPGIKENHPDCIKYINILTYGNILVAICGMVNKKYLPNQFNIFYPIIKNTFLHNYERLTTLIENNIHIKEFITTGIYNSKILVDYEKLKNELIKCKSLLEDNK